MTQANRPLPRHYHYRGHTFSGPEAVPLPFIPVAVAGTIVILLLGVALWYQVANLGRVYPGVSVFGVDLGGLDPDTAVISMREQVADYAGQPIVLQYAAREWRVAPADLGLRFDASSAVRAAYAVGREGDILQRIVTRLHAGIFGEPLDNLGLLLDQQAADTFIAGLAQQVDRPVVDAELTITEDGKVGLSPSQIGRKLDRRELIRRLGPVLLARQETPVALPVQESYPKVTEASFSDANAQAKAILRNSFTLTTAEVTRTLTVADLASLLTVNTEGSGDQLKATLVIDDTGLQGLLEEMGKAIQQEPSNARFEWVSARQLRVIREGKPGRRLDVPAALDLIKQKVSGAERALALPVTVIEPAVRSEDATTLAFPALIDENYTSYAGSIPDRAHNVELATERLNGIVVMPGQTFSFNQELGPTTLKTGYRWGYGITRTDSGSIETIPSVAGGICQVATTLFQPIFMDGYQIEERNWHLYWIPKYGNSPRGLQGLDATVDDPGLDFKWTNTTPDPVLIQARTQGQKVYFRLYGKKPAWTVKIDGPKITNVKKANTKVVREVDQSLPPGRELWVETAEDGFDVEIVRTVTSGSDVRTLRMRSTYEPARNVILVGPGGAQPAQPAEESAPDSLNRPTGAATATAQPTKPAAQATQPAAQATQPAAQATQPAAQPTQPAAQATQPAATPQATVAPTPQPTAAPAPTQPAPAKPKPTAATKPGPTAPARPKP